MQPRIMNVPRVRPRSRTRGTQRAVPRRIWTLRASGKGRKVHRVSLERALRRTQLPQFSTKLHAETLHWLLVPMDAYGHSAHPKKCTFLSERAFQDLAPSVLNQIAREYLWIPMEHAIMYYACDSVQARPTTATWSLFQALGGWSHMRACTVAGCCIRLAASSGCVDFFFGARLA
jgi:hypothetical protein